MENASKALIMAAGVLLGIMVLSLAVFLFANFGGTSEQIHQTMEADQLNQFNTQYTKYLEKKDVTIYDVISVANLANENNRYYEFKTRQTTGEARDGKDAYISVWLKDSDISGAGQYIEYGAEKSNSDITKKYNELITTVTDNLSTSSLPTYQVSVDISPTTNRVYMVTFTR